jgi:tetratricopeptide (TPR) repeat protein
VRNRALALFLVLGLATTGASQPPPIADPDVRRGIALVDEGEYDSAILALDAAVRRLAADKGHSTADLAEAYFYLGVAYLGKGHETSAKARFREAVQQARDMSPSPEKFPPRVIELFEKAKEESRAEMAAATSTGTPRSAETKKGGSGKALLIVGGVAAVGGGAALALGGGGGGGGATPTTTLPALQTFTANGTIADGDARYFTFVATRAGTAEATVTWQDRAMNLPIGCQFLNPPYRECPGNYNRTTDTSGRYTTAVVQDSYLLSVSNYEGRAGEEPFTITIRYP